MTDVTTPRLRLNKVPEPTPSFWTIKILATTVGETAADLISTGLHLGPQTTSLIMTALLVVALIAQFRTVIYTPAVYWLTVVLISVVGTLITDNLTDGLGVPLAVSTIVFAVALGVTFAVWYARERTLSILEIDTTRREAFYWLAILFTFAPVAAGVGKMRWATFTVFNVVGAAVWATAVILLGYGLGHIPVVVTFVSSYLDLILIGIVVISVVPVLVRAITLRMRRRRASERVES